LASYDIRATCIGQITGATGKIDLRLNEKPFEFESKKFGFEHFS
jgi:thiamine-monophosphate kinase